MEAFTREKSLIPTILFLGISTWPESGFVVVVSVFVLFSMSPPSWSTAEISKVVSTLDLKHTDDTDASVKQTSIANYVIDDPFEISEVNFVAVSVFVLFSMSPPSWSIAEISTSRVSTLDLKHTDDTDASVQRTSVAKLHNPLSL